MIQGQGTKMEYAFKRIVLHILYISFISNWAANAQEQLPSDKMIGKLASYAMKNSPEKVYLHTDKHIYTNGETIWFKAYLVDGILHKASEKSEVIYVELWDSKDSLVVRQKLPVDELGASGSIPLPINCVAGNFLIRGYTKYMLNENSPAIFQKEIPVFVQEFGDYKNQAAIPIPIPRNKDSDGMGDLSKDVKPIVRFFPEGGHLISGLINVMGIKAVDSHGHGLALKGTIQDGKGEPVAFFKSYGSGLGTVSFTPKKGETYQAVVSYDESELNFKVPEVKPEGHVLSIRNNGEYLTVNVTTNLEEGLAGTFLLGHFRGDLFFERIGKPEDGDTYSVRLKTDRLFDGIAHFTLFTAMGEPVCERLTFIDHPKNELQVVVSSNAKTYGAREMVALDIGAVDAKGTTFKGDFSMSAVAASNKLPQGNAYTTVKSWLLLNSDLGNSVTDAAYFFEDDSRERKYMLDALMLTHGWRRFVWKDFVTGQNSKMMYVPEKRTGTILSGFTAMSKNPKHLKSAKVLLRIPSLNLIEEQITDGKGRFNFGPFDLKNGAETYLEVVKANPNPSKNKYDIKIFLDDEWPSVPLHRAQKVSVNGSPKTQRKDDDNTLTRSKAVLDYLAQSYRKKNADFEDDPSITQLDEVAVSTKKKTELQDIESQVFHGDATIRIFADSTGTAAGLMATDLLARAPGVRILPDGGIRIPGLSGMKWQSNVPPPIDSAKPKGEPLFFVDGSEVTFDYIADMFASEVLFVDVLRGIEAAIYGIRGYDGVISIVTKSRLSKGNTETKTRISPKAIIPGFEKQREFFLPDYSFKRPEHERPDYRTTLFWKPLVKVDDTSKEPIQFYTGDTKGDFIITVEGITKDGRAVSGQHTIEVR